MAALLSTVLACGGLVMLQATPAAAATSITVSKSAPSTVLLGDDITYSLTASNPADDGDSDLQYNLSFRDVLPVGVSYVSTTAPIGQGNPTIIPEKDGLGVPTGRTILIWSNVADLPDGSDVKLTYTVSPDVTDYPVGSTVGNQATGYVSSNERYLAKFDAGGSAVTNPVISSDNASASTSISALKITKSEPSPEHELVRGVHDRTTVYTLTVTNNGINPTNDVTVVDYIPAGLEFLGCGTADNTSADDREYTGAPRLDAGPDVSSDCPTPFSVTTTDSPPTGYPSGVYTRVEWHLPANLAASGEYVIKYSAAIPLKKNVMPTVPAGFVSTANLDNNTGDSTRETGTEQAYKNLVRASGAYQGVDNHGATGTTVTADDQLTVTSEDIAVVKSLPGGNKFDQNGETSYRLLVRVSEYTDGADIELIDTLPDGLCPSDAPSSTYTATAQAAATGESVPPGSGNQAIKTFDHDGGVYNITFNKLTISAATGSATIDYKARNRSLYAGGSDTSAGDTYTNTVGLTGTTTPIANTGETGTQAVLDDSSATITSDAPELDKRVLPNTAATHSCNDPDWAGHWKDSQIAAADEPFTVGSRVCFQVRVTFPTTTSTRAPVVTDYLPDNLTYEPGTFELVAGANTATYAVDQAAINTGFADGTHTFKPGITSGSNLYVAKGKVLAFRFSAIVSAAPASTVDVQGNLAKLRWTDRAGKVSSLRDQADFKVPPPPPVKVDKRVQEVLPTPTALNDDEPVLHGTRVRYQVDVTNQGTDAASNGIDINGIDLWDVLPVGFRCADLVPGTLNLAIATCFDPPPVGLGHPHYTGSSTLSVITWSLPDTDVLAPLEDNAANVRTFSYELIVPTNTSVGTSYVNTASVRTYNTATNLGGVAPHYPASNVDSDVPGADQDVPAASDIAKVTLPKVGLTKSNTTNQTDGFNGDHDAVPGETITYTIRATVPSLTTVYNGVLTDPLPPVPPANFTFVSATAGYSATGASPATDPLPGTVTFNNANGTLTFPATWENSSATPQVFEVTVKAKVAVGYTGTCATVADCTNTATFASKTTAGGSVPVSDVTATSVVNIVQPSPTLTKTSVPSSAPVAGQTVTYTLTAKNAASKPTLYDTVVVDCVPAGLTVLTVGPGATPAAGTGVAVNGCAVGKTAITWTIGSIAANASTALVYTAKVDPFAAGAASYQNTATLTGSTLANGSNTVTDERVLTTTASKTLTLAGAAAAKTIVDNTLTVGEKASYTVSGTFPADINFFDASLIDALPAGLDASTLNTTSVKCLYADSTLCTLPSPGGGSALSTSGQNVGWFLGDLGPDAKVRTVTIAFTATVADNCTDTANATCNTIGRTRSNAVSVKWNLTNKTDPTSASGTFDKTITSTPAVFTVLEPKTAITKTVVSATPAPGENFTYTVTVSNPGGTNVSDAFNVSVKDVVPDGVIVDPSSLTAAGGVLTGATATGGGTITWPAIATLTTSGPGSSKVFTYVAKLAASSTLSGAALTNTASVPGFDGLPTGGRHYTGPQTTAKVTPAFPHVKIAKQVVGSAVSYVDKPQNFEITVTSDGASPAYDIDVDDVLPKNWSYDLGSATVQTGAGPANPQDPTDNNANPATISWNDLAHSGLPVGQTIVITYTATPGSAATTDAGSGSTVDHVNKVSVAAEDATDATSSGAGNYHGPDATAAAQIHRADLVVAKAGVGTPVAGQDYSWTINVTNEGPDASVGPIVVTDTIPSHFTDVTGTGTGWSCSLGTGTITCTHAGPVAVGGPGLPPLTVKGLVAVDTNNGTVLTNKAVVAGKTFETDLTDNTATATATVKVKADLALDKSLSGPLEAGSVATYVLIVTNEGPSDSHGPFTVADDLPSGSTFVSAAGTGWTCPAPVGGVLTCTHDDGLAAGTPADQIVVKVKIPATQTADVKNAATVHGNDDPNPANDDSSVTTTPTRTADLLLEKSLKGGTATAGNPATYTLHVLNNGPSTATHTTIVDVLPAYLTFVDSSGSGWTCSAASQTVTCDLSGALGLGEANATDVELNVLVASGYTGEIYNEAKVTATEDPTGSTDDDSNTPLIRSDLEIEKTHTGTVVAGTSITYDVKVTNHGPSDTDGPIVVTDTVPDGLTYKSSSGSGWTCDDSTPGEVTCTHLTGLVDDASSTVALTFDIAADAGPATVDNRVSVNGPNIDPVPGNNNDVDPTEITDSVNVSIVKKAVDTTVAAGANASWTIDVTNDGPSIARSVAVGDILPLGLTIVSISGGGWDCTKTPAVGCTRATLAPGAAPQITVVTKVGSGVASGVTITNPATVATSTPGDLPGDNDSQDSITTSTSADLTLTKTHTGTPVAGEDFTFTLDGHNAGPSDAAGPIKVTDELPVGMTYVSANDAWACTPGAVTGSGQEVVCTLVSGGPVVSGDDVPTLAMKVHVGPDTAGTALANTASIDAATSDPDPGNDGDDDSVTPTGKTDLSVTKTHSGPVVIGQQLEFTVTVHNEGPSEARNVEVADALPTGLTYVSASGTGWTCDEVTADCELDDPLSVGADAEPITLIVEVTSAAYPEVTNVVTVSTDTEDTDSSNDHDSDKVVVPPKVDLSVVKALEGTLKVGDVAHYSLTIHNGGPTLDPGTVTVTDQLPAGLAYVSATADGWTCSEAAGLVTCKRPDDFAVGATSVLMLTVLVGPAAYPSVANTASVASPAADDNPDNNVSTVSDPVSGTALLSISKKVSEVHGTSADFKIVVTNLGPTETTAPVTVTDDLPKGLKYVGASGDGWACSHVTATITCTYASNLPVGAAPEILVRTKITAHDGEKIVNFARATGGPDDGGDDPVVSDGASVKAPGGNGLLPDTGGLSLWLMLMALVAMAVGSGLVRRRPTRGRHAG